MEKHTIALLLFFLAALAQAQSEDKTRNIGINYYGELGIRPGFEVDYGFPLLVKGVAKENKKRFFSYQLHLRPALAYYRFAHNSNNFLLAAKFNYQLRIVNTSNSKHLSVEPFVKLGYLRKSYIGEIFQTTNLGFEEVGSAGTNSFVLGGGLDFGGYLTSKIDWLFGVDYFIENTSDELILHRFFAKLGVRIKLKEG